MQWFPKILASHLNLDNLCTSKESLPKIFFRRGKVEKRARTTARLPAAIFLYKYFSFLFKTAEQIWLSHPTYSTLSTQSQFKTNLFWFEPQTHCPQLQTHFPLYSWVFHGHQRNSRCRRAPNTSGLSTSEGRLSSQWQFFQQARRRWRWRMDCTRQTERGSC